ncbi:hypothetical protein [Microbacterium sp. B24]|uniref:hypothetical protein n=1 Tax=Microbacterium sp. B24 TaxID=95616 RepID=UPI00042244DF|nr:hypothetical protein [Microbacterium sp. B24]
MRAATWPADVKAGARVRIAKVDDPARDVEGQLARVDFDGELVLMAPVSHGGSLYTGVFPSTPGVTVTVLPPPPPQLPTAAGYYVDTDGDVWRIRDEGAKPYFLGEADINDPESYLPFTRLVPETSTTD